MSGVFGDIRSAAGGFFGSLSEAVGEAVHNVGSSDILPRWVSSQLGLQTEDQLRDNTYNPDPTKPRINATAVSGGNTTETANGSALKIIGSGANVKNMMIVAGVFAVAMFVMGRK